MAIYCVGDVQGCYDELRRLLDLARFDPANDELWLTGDLVARGPKSLEVLRFVHSLGFQATTVLGNHDLHLLATAAGYTKPKKKTDWMLCSKLMTPTSYCAGSDYNHCSPNIRQSLLSCAMLASHPSGV